MSPINVALQRATARMSTPRAEGATTAAELRQVQQELTRLTEAVALGGCSVPALLFAIQDGRVGAATSSRGCTRDPLRSTRVPCAPIWRMGWPIGADWPPNRATHGRRLLKQLIVGRLDITPNQEERYYDFRGTGTLVTIISGAVPQSEASPPGFVTLWTAELTGRMAR